MNETVQISIIIPVCNTQYYLRTCLDSISVQALESFEVIIVDDCSSDTIPLELLNQYPFPISLIRLEAKGGPGGARNRGITSAKGKYIAFCDSDDWVDAQYYKDTISLMNEHVADIAMCSLVRNYEEQTAAPIYKCYYDQVIELSGDVALRILTKQYDLGFLIVPSSTNKVFRKSYLDQIGLRFPENIMFEDLLFSFIAVMNASKIITIPKVRYHHYKRNKSITQSFSRQHIDDYTLIFRKIRQYLKDHGKYSQYRNNYYKFAEQFYNLIIRQIFQFEHSEDKRKAFIAYSLQQIKTILDFDEFIEYSSAEQLRQHIQPHIKDTTIY